MNTSNFFIPLNLKLDPEEKQNFIRQQLDKVRAQANQSDEGLRNVGTVSDFFPKTIAATNQVVSPIGLKVRTVNLFSSRENVKSTTIHADGLSYPSYPAAVAKRLGKLEINPVMLEARISYYEIAESPGIINWWEDMPVAPLVVDAQGMNPMRINFVPSYYHDLKSGKATWNDVPLPTCSVSTNVSSALLRTNVAHNVDQGPGLRITISCQLVFANGDPRGVWQHIQTNINKLGI